MVEGEENKAKVAEYIAKQPPDECVAIISPALADIV